jgi:hypothetical protein
MLYSPWTRLGLSTASLWWEASRVIAMRSALLAAGGASAEAESARLIPEKIAALVEAQMAFATDVALGRAHRSPQKTIGMYSKRVRSNLRRLKKRR